jgi:hypothetical protein
MNNSLAIKRSWVKKAGEPMMKYNKGFVHMVEEWVGDSAADYRGGEDTGIDPIINSNQNHD